MDLLPYWNLRERPFETTWDTRFFFQSRDHDEALDLLTFHEEGEPIQGFIMVATLEKETRVPSGLKGALAQVPVWQQIHDFTLVTAGGHCTHYLAFGRAVLIGLGSP